MRRVTVTATILRIPVCSSYTPPFLIDVSSRRWKLLTSTEQPDPFILSPRFERFQEHFKPFAHKQESLTCTQITNSNSVFPTNMSDNRFAVDYAKRIAGCKKCKQKIEKGECRLAKVTANFFNDGDGDMKQYHHPKCLFETFLRARATTKIIEGADDIEGFTDLNQEDKDAINQLIKETAAKKGSPKKKTTPKAKAQTKLPFSPSKKTPESSSPVASTSALTGAKNGHDDDDSPPSPTPGGSTDQPTSKDDAFKEFRRLCADIAEQPGYNDKTKTVATFLSRGTSGDGYHGDMYLLLKLLLPGVIKIVYNLNSKQLVKIFSQIFGQNLEEMQEDLEQGDVAETVRCFYEKSKICPPQKKSTLSIQQVDAMLTELSKFTKEDDQQRVLAKITRRSTANDLKMVIRLIKHDLRINAGAKHVLDALDPNAHEAFKASRNLRDVVDKVVALRQSNKDQPGLKKTLSIKADVMTPMSPMLAEACKSVDFAFKRCPNGMYAEIKYDGERVQVHKNGDNFGYFSRSLKPVQAHKVQHFKEFIPKAFPGGNSLILDSEVLLIDTKTSKPLPFGTLGVHKKQAFEDANVCLFVFDCIFYNGENLMTKPIKERRKILHKNMTEIPNRIMFSEMTHIREREDLQDLMLKVFREGLEGLVLKDVNSQYEPGKRHWLKVKKDYLAEGAMADSADLVVLGAYFGTGNKGGLMSIFLMGTYDPATSKWCTVSKCGSGFDDKTLDRLQKEFDMVKISKDASKIPSWLNINKNVMPDFVVKDPQDSQVWEITGAEFSKSDSHTAGGISIRFPRCTKMRPDKSWKEATDLPRLKALFKKSKEYSDIPDFISGKKGKSPAKKGKSPPPEDDSDKMETDEDNSSKNNANGSRNATPVKRKLEESDDESSSTPVKKARSKPSCKYGAACYQKSPDHRAKFEHGKNTSKRVSKHLPDVFTGLKFYIPTEVKDRERLVRYVIAFDGDVVKDFEKSSATHIVGGDEEGGASRQEVVTVDWLWACIKKKALVPAGDS